jgi:hypothetical protein
MPEIEPARSGVLLLVMLAKARPRLSYEEYCQIELSSPIKHEFLEVRSGPWQAVLANMQPFPPTWSGS